MYGIGTLTASYIYDTLVRIPGNEAHSFLRRIAPEFHEYRRIRQMFIASREHKYLYVVNPKVASTSIRNRLRELNGYPPLDNPREVMGHKGSGFVLPKHMNKDELYRICSGREGYFNFSFVRNPFDRLASAYTYFQQVVEERKSYGAKNSIYLRAKDPHRDPKTRQKMPFDEFIKGVCTPTEFSQDQHWRTQTDVLKADFIDYSFIGKIENFSSDFTHVLRCLSAPEPVIARAGDVTNASKRKQRALRDLFDEKSADLVRDKFQEDFRRFGYPLEIPSGE